MKYWILITAVFLGGISFGQQKEKVKLSVSLSLVDVSETDLAKYQRNGSGVIPYVFGVFPLQSFSVQAETSKNFIYRFKYRRQNLTVVSPLISIPFGAHRNHYYDYDRNAFYFSGGKAWNYSETFKFLAYLNFGWSYSNSTGNDFGMFGSRPNYEHKLSALGGIGLELRKEIRTNCHVGLESSLDILRTRTSRPWRGSISHWNVATNALQVNAVFLLGRCS